jgi:uncharacterized membrane protein (UPF0127 family)
MRHIRIVNKTRDSVLGAKVLLADNWWLRARGFLGRPMPQAGEGLFLSPCRAVHMIGMRYPLDVIFLDRNGGVVAAYESLRPNRSTAWHRDAEYAIEVPPGTVRATATSPDDVLVWLPAEEDGNGGGPERNGGAPRQGSREDARQSGNGRSSDRGPR